MAVERSRGFAGSVRTGGGCRIDSDYRLAMLALGTEDPVDINDSMMLILSRKIEAQPDCPEVADEVREQLLDRALLKNGR